MKKLIIPLVLSIFFVNSCLLDSFDQYEVIPSDVEVVDTTEMPIDTVDMTAVTGPVLFSYDDFNGTMATDDSGNGLDVTFSGFTIGQEGENSYLITTGDGDFLIENLDLSELDSFTFTMWVRSFYGNEQIIMSQDGTNLPSGTLILDEEVLGLSENMVSINDRGLDVLPLINSNLLNGQWNMLTITGSLEPTWGSFSVYVNDEFIGKETSLSPELVDGAVIRLLASFEGEVDKITLLNIIESLDEVNDRYSISQSDHPVTVNQGISVDDYLFCYYDFDEGNGFDKVSGIHLLDLPVNGATFSNDIPNDSGSSLELTELLENGVEFDRSVLYRINSLSVAFWLKIDAEFQLDTISSATVLRHGFSSTDELFFTHKGIDIGFPTGGSRFNNSVSIRATPSCQRKNSTGALPQTKPLPCAIPPPPYGPSLLISQAVA